MSAKRYVLGALLAALFVYGAATLAQVVLHFSALSGLGPRVGLIETAIAAGLISPLWLWALHRLERP